MLTTPTPVCTDGRDSETEEFERHIQNHPLVQKLRVDPAYDEYQPHPELSAYRDCSLTGRALLGKDMIGGPPLSFNRSTREKQSHVQIFYLGTNLCCHPGIIHGGLLATLLDEGLALACFPTLPSKIGVTASLSVRYKNPCPTESYIVVTAETTKVQGKKAWATGRIQLLEDGVHKGMIIAEAEALFVEPRDCSKLVERSRGIIERQTISMQRTEEHYLDSTVKSTKATVMPAVG